MAVALTPEGRERVSSTLDSAHQKIAHPIQALQDVDDVAREVWPDWDAACERARAGAESVSTASAVRRDGSSAAPSGVARDGVAEEIVASGRDSRSSRKAGSHRPEVIEEETPRRSSVRIKGGEVSPPVRSSAKVKGRQAEREVGSVIFRTGLGRMVSMAEVVRLRAEVSMARAQVQQAVERNHELNAKIKKLREEGAMGVVNRRSRAAVIGGLWKDPLAET